MTVAGKVQVNSNHPCGLLLNGSSFKVQAVQTSVVGGACYQNGTIAGAVIEGADIELDPPAHLLPDNASWNAFKTAMPQPLGPNGQINAPGTYGPGHYPQGLSLASTDQVVLLPGHYMFGGAGVTLPGSSFISGDDVTLFIDQGATVDISGSGAGASLTATKSGEYQGIAFFHHRQNGPGVQSKITGGGLFDVQGLIYVPAGELVMGGNPGKEIGAIIVNTLGNVGVTGFSVTGKGIPPSELIPWCDLGAGLVGATGIPQLAGTGSLIAGTPGQLDLTSASPLSPTMLFVSPSNTPTPFKGGMLQAVPVVLQLGLATASLGAWSLQWASWPAGLPPGTDLYFQCAVSDQGAIQAVAISNLLKATTP
jgi:hypothetical protein